MTRRGADDLSTIMSYITLTEYWLKSNNFLLAFTTEFIKAKLKSVMAVENNVSYLIFSDFV